MPMKPYASEKPGQQLVEKCSVSYEDLPDNPQNHKNIKKLRQEERAARRTQTKRARQFLKNSLRDEVDNLELEEKVEVDNDSETSGESG